MARIAGTSIMQLRRAPDSRLSWEAFDDIQTGDLIRYYNNERKVRWVTRCQHGYLRSIRLSILRSSWTGQPVTIVTRSSLHTGYGGIVQPGVSLRSTSLEADLQDAIEELARGPAHLRWKDVSSITAREVVEAGIV